MNNENLYLLNNQQKNSEKKKTVKIIIIALMIIISFFIGIIIGISNNEGLDTDSGSGKVTNQNAKPSYLLKNVNFKLFWQVWDIIQDKYIEADIGDLEMFYGAQAGLVASLGDPYSVFLNCQFLNIFFLFHCLILTFFAEGL